MGWEEFLKAGFPAEFSAKEANKSIIWKVNRWVGIRFAYVFFKLGMSANALSVLRAFIAIIGLSFIHFISYGDKWLPLLGVFLVIWQVNLDFADGVIARVQGKSSALGETLDGLANAISRLGIIILMGLFTNRISLIMLSVFSSYVLVPFKGSRAVVSKRFSAFSSNLYHKSLSVVAMVIILPIIISLHCILDINILLLSYSVVSFYGFLSVYVLCRASDL